MRAAASGAAGTVRSWSLVRRLTGGVLLVALLSFMLQAVVLLLWLRPVAAEAGAMAAEHALLVRSALAAVPPAERAALARQLSSALITVSPQPPADGGADALLPPPEFASLTAALRREGVDVRIDPGADGAATLVFRLPVAGQVWWLQRQVTRPDSALTGTVLVWLLLLAGVTAGALWMSVRLIARPLGALADQLTAQQGRLQPLRLHSDSSDELQALVRAFNQLVQQVTAAAQARQQLLAGVSHDLRTPLARLRLRAETQCEPVLADALTTDLVALERIVNQFLAYVQGDNGAPLGQPAPLARSVAAVVQRYADQGLAVRLAQDEGSQQEQQAPDLAVQRLLANLIDNALAYGAGPVDVALRASAQGAELCVSDGGPGMSDEEFERAQQPFVRLTRARSELGHCGLGLAIVAQMARQLGGHLRVERGRDGRFGIVCALPRHAP
jgi:two-component system osmolarity sensor histidine kinase EnvZ